MGKPSSTYDTATQQHLDQEGTVMTQQHEEQAPEPTPYDTGERCEPKIWLPYGSKVTEATPAENFGKVDFDDDMGDTVALVHVERDRNGHYTVHVDSYLADDGLSIERH